MNDEIERVQMTIDQAQAKVIKSEKWEKLLGSPLFKELITEDYLGDDAVRLTMNLKPRNEDNEVLNTMLQAKSIFSRFVANVLQEGEMARNSIEEHLELKGELEKNEAGE